MSIESATVPQTADLTGSLDVPIQSVHLWLAFYDDGGDDRLHCAYRDLLSASEREQERRFHFAADRRRYLVTRALVRTVLSRYAPIGPRDWSFRSNRYGRPEIANVTVNELQLSFNVSHTRGLIALAVTARRAVGLDVENIQVREVPLDVADRFFAPPEVAALAKVPPDRRRALFFEYWTFKESYIKARGMGLSLPLDKFCFDYPTDDSVGMSISPDLADEAARWQFWQFRPTPDYLVALCAGRLGDGQTDVVVRRVVPMNSEMTMLLPCTRASGNRISALRPRLGPANGKARVRNDPSAERARVRLAGHPEVPRWRGSFDRNGRYQPKLGGKRGCTGCRRIGLDHGRQLGGVVNRVLSFLRGMKAHG